MAPPYIYIYSVPLSLNGVYVMTTGPGQQVDTMGERYTDYSAAPPPGGDSYMHGRDPPPYIGPPPAANPLMITFILAVIGVVMMLIAGIIRGVLFHESVNDENNYLMMVEIFNSIGVACLSIGLLFGATMREELSDTVRTGLLVAVGILLGLWASGGFASLPWYY